MTQNTITLNIGENFISFPEGSTSSFRQIFTDSGMLANVVSINRYDPVISSFKPVDLDLDLIYECRGYILTIKSTGTPILPIIYDGIPFPITMNFDKLKLFLFSGWNLIGTDTNTIDTPDWCVFIDAFSGIRTNKILPTKAYWINSKECQVPIKDYGLLVSLGIFSLFFYDIVIKGSSKIKVK